MSVARKKLTFSKFSNVNPLRRMKTQHRVGIVTEPSPMVPKSDHVKLEPINRYQTLAKTHYGGNTKIPLRRLKTERNQMNVSSIILESSVHANQDETIANLITDINI